MSRLEGMKTFAPRLDILPPAQRALWPELAATPPEFTLYGGTAIALQLGHRRSVDFDFFGDISFSAEDLLARVPYLAGGRVVQSAPGTLTVWVDRRGTAKVSFFGAPKLGVVEAPLVAEGSGVKAASLIDLAALTTVVVQSRAEAKDFIDIDAVIGSGIDLSSALAAACAIQGPGFNPQVSLKALSYFEDGDLGTLDAALKRRLQSAVRGVDVEALPTIKAARPYSGGGQA